MKAQRNDRYGSGWNNAAALSLCALVMHWLEDRQSAAISPPDGPWPDFGKKSRTQRKRGIIE